jgi:hypothetical protein
MATSISHFDDDKPLHLNGVLDRDNRLTLLLSQGTEHVTIAFADAYQADTVASAIPHLIDELNDSEPIITIDGATLRTTRITMFDHAHEGF